jgi:cob(I)alamin adenosyltransferase
MMLVFMDLISGYVLLEEGATDRTYETWYERVKARLEPLQTSVLYLVSDRAKALIKLAKTGLACPSIPDLFHLLHELVKGYSLVIWRQVKTARQALSRAQEHLATCQAEGASQSQIESAQVAVATGEADVAHWQQVRDTYRGHLEAMSLQVHPWRVTDSAPQSSQEVEAQLAAEVAALQEVLEINGLPVKKKVLDKVRKQLAGLAAVIDVWWQTVRHIVLAGKQGRCAQSDHLDTAVDDLGGGALVAADVLAAASIPRAGSAAQSPAGPGARGRASRL